MLPHETATFAAGCFWGVEDALMSLAGVIQTEVGYTGGHKQNPTYREVCSDQTGHAEAVQVIFDPEVISYETLLKVFWKIHNPTTLNRQGPDVGSQYRSAIFYHTEEQKQKAQASKEWFSNNGPYKQPIVTEITPVSQFYRAEEYHQKYHLKNGGHCAIPS